MNRVFSVSLERLHHDPVFITRNYCTFAVIAPNAKKAIDKAIARARRELAYRGQWIVSKLKHRGVAV